MSRKPRQLPATCAAILALTFAGAACADVHTMIVTSDPQYPWTEKTDQRIAEDDDARNARSEALIREQYRSIVAYRAAHPDETIPVIINGDLTAYGHGWQRSKMDELLGILGENVHLGLGNHDYENNISRQGGEGCYNNGCARDSVEDLARHVRRNSARISFDWATQSGAITDSHSGSLAYAFAAKGFTSALQFQLNNHPNYAVSFSSNHNLRQQYYTIGPSTDWLDRSLRNLMPYPQHEFAIVHMHQPEWDGAFARTIQNHNVVAIFAGHFHRALGRESYSVGDIPVYLSGSASQRSYLIVEHDDERNELRIFAVRDNDPAKKELIDTLSTNRRG